ncbi:hypothetical protein DSTSK_10580 [Desulforhabdus sp. TSK]|nr:hypothetical protein DSTSK_10580 [Desulforhabdus sp. TSK]
MTALRRCESIFKNLLYFLDIWDQLIYFAGVMGFWQATNEKPILRWDALKDGIEHFGVFLKKKHVETVEVFCGKVGEY